MKKVFLSMLALILAMGLVLSTAAPALAGELYHFKGIGANAYWFMYDEDTGVYTDIFVYGRDVSTQNPPGRPQTTQYAGIEIFQYRYEGEEFIPISDVSYWGPIPAGCLVIERNLASARLIAYGLEAWEWDYITEEGTAVSLDVDVSWIATGPLSRESYKWRYHSPYVNVNYRYTGSSRGATAQGGINYDGTSIILGVSNGAGIFSAKEGFVEVSR